MQGNGKEQKEQAHTTAGELHSDIYCSPLRLLTMEAFDKNKFGVFCLLPRSLRQCVTAAWLHDNAPPATTVVTGGLLIVFFDNNHSQYQHSDLRIASGFSYPPQLRK
ncbi:hypothetical protein MRB53_002523 [Persea americana]|uniref:Uncharacterized protein n=1 Tax=Persea americana TaxID=3435 RepID=A0ACC2MV00_PERAE|nr:hypothetical protein MRB53_002523 [Persea americana]